MADLVARWPEAVGRGIARNAWPARIARDGTLHVNTPTRSGRSSSAIARPRSRGAWACRRSASRPARCRSRPERRRRAPATARADPGAGPREAARDRRRRSTTRSSVNASQKAAAFEPRQGRSTDRRCLIHFDQPAKRGFCRAFSLCDLKTSPIRKGHHRPRRPRAGPPAAGHVHRLDRPARPPPPRLRGGRQRRRRGDGRPQRQDRGDDPPRQLGDGARPRARDPRRHDRRSRAAGDDGRSDEAPRRRQVRRRGLQGLRRPARRRRVGRERALRVARSPRSSATGRSTGRSSRAATRRAT